MLLGMGIWLGVIGYSGVYWGVKLFTGKPETFGQVLGWSKAKS